jgi:hypothetical protein
MMERKGGANAPFRTGAHPFYGKARRGVAARKRKRGEGRRAAPRERAARGGSEGPAVARGLRGARGLGGLAVRSSHRRALGAPVVPVRIGGRTGGLTARLDSGGVGLLRAAVDRRGWGLGPPPSEGIPSRGSPIPADGPRRIRRLLDRIEKRWLRRRMLFDRVPRVPGGEGRTRNARRLGREAPSGSAHHGIGRKLSSPASIRARGIGTSRTGVAGGIAFHSASGGHGRGRRAGQMSSSDAAAVTR